MPAAKEPQCRAVESGLEKRMGPSAEWSGLLGLRVQGEGTEPERTSAFPIKVYS